MKLIVLVDAGHGPDTAGKRSVDGSLREFNFNHPTATILMSKLVNYNDVEIHSVYNPAEDTPLSTRVNKANSIYQQNLSDIKSGKTKIIYVSVHANAHKADQWTDAQGIETFAASTSAKEAVVLASNVQTHLIRETGRKNRGVKYAPFYVLKNTKMPAILVESGFMTNREEMALLKTKTYQEKIASAIEHGIVQSYGLKLKDPVQKPTPPKQNPPSGKVRYVVQAGAFSSKANADKLAQLLKQKGFSAFVKEE